MHFDSSIDPNTFFMGYPEFIQVSGLDRNQIRSAIHAKKITNIILGGHPFFYRVEAEKFIETLKAQKAKEAQHA